MIGGASGIGHALCQELSKHGATVIVGDVNIAEAQRTVSNIIEAGGRAQCAFLDVSRIEDVQAVMDKTVAEYEKLDYVFNSAGIAIVGEVFDMHFEHWQRLLDVNLLGVIHSTNAAYSVMVKQGSGHIVNIASMAGLIPAPTGTAYAMTKHAVVGLSTSLRVEAAALGVKVSVACPGAIQTAIFNRTTVLKGNLSDVFPRRLVKPMDATSCAQAILRGVIRNNAIITVPFWHTRPLWWLYRLCPAIVFFISSYRIKRYRNLYSKSS